MECCKKCIKFCEKRDTIENCKDCVSEVYHLMKKIDKKIKEE